MTLPAPAAIVSAMVKGVLIDIAGVVTSGETLLPGARAALARLDAAGLPYRFVTNTTRKPVRALLAQFAAHDLDVARDHVFTPAQAAVAWLGENGYAPHLLVHADLMEDFAPCRTTGPRAVVVGDAGSSFTYASLNAAFRQIVDGAPFLALATNRVFRDTDGELSLDAGAFVTALEHASETSARVLGKPAPAFFAAAAASMELKLSDVAMIGDDAEADVAGALRAGAGTALLVRSGKYREGDEGRVTPAPSATVADIGAAVERLLRS